MYVDICNNRFACFVIWKYEISNGNGGIYRCYDRRLYI